MWLVSYVRVCSLALASLIQMHSRALCFYSRKESDNKIKNMGLIIKATENFSITQPTSPPPRTPSLQKWMVLPFGFQLQKIFIKIEELNIAL